jgi:uncharacterized protein YbcC (UPF0753/DUF2309 family)
MSTDSTVYESIERAATTVGPAWPLHSFVTSNPLAGFEDRPFHEAVREGSARFGGRGYPSAETFRAAWEDGRIDPDRLETELRAHGYEAEPETLLARMEATAMADESDTKTATDRVDQLLTKWLSAFTDQGKAHWPMPNRREGFYDAFRSVARHDSAIPDRERIAALPDEPTAALREVLADYPTGEWEDIFAFHLSALPGWTGYIKQRVADDGDWQQAYPITLPGYLAARLALTEAVGAPIAPPEDATAECETPGDVPLAECWLRAWEGTYREQLVETVAAESADRSEGGTRPDAQLVFCIDTRSEIIRRHIERAGEYETHGYAGFFGIPMRYEGYDADVTVDACPPILDAEHHIEETPTDETVQADRDYWTRLRDLGDDLLHSMQANAATAFAFVESAGAGYGTALAARTLLPARVYDLLDTADERVPDDHDFCTPAVEHDTAGDGDLPAGLTFEERVEYAATAFELMGWETFARVVVFAGHASQTANNPFDSSLDCGACAGNPGGPSARVLATICNDEDVKAALRERGVAVPEDTIFVAGEHNTTTDEVMLFDSHVPESHAEDIEQLRADLEQARAGASAERAASMGGDGTDGIRETERRAADWAETRPEWGLAGNAAFVVGPREITADLDLDGRSFLHSYDWSTDPDGSALEGIMAGPMVVTQWINSQYYFATVDNAAYGSGSKITQNPVGNVGVVQGNGGDLLTGLPLQSLMASDDQPYHQPLRLSTVIHAPVDRVTEILADHEHLADLLDNGWLSLTVVDPEQDSRAFVYDGDLAWRPMERDETRPTATPTRSTPTR